jgi:uncharacterized protein (DUF1501 family)
MKKITRKEFIGTSLLAGCSIFVPRLLQGSGALLSSGTARKLVVVQLSGGNDGLNTIIPYRNDLYYSNRPNISYAANAVLPLNSELALNPVMKGMKNLYDNGDLCIINSVGYPEPDRSHFRSMDIWHTASRSNEYLETGWIGRFLDVTCADCHNAHLALEADDMLSLAMKGNRVNGMAVKDPGRLYRASKDPFYEGLTKMHNDLHHHQTVDYLYRTAIETSASVDYLYQKSRIEKTAAVYPDNEFGKNLKLIAGLLCAESETQIYYISLSGFDTHARQKLVQERLLETFSNGLSAFASDLKKNNMFDNTLVMTFSEFGRRVKENGSGGTDHGAGNNVILMGGALKKTGVYNETPDLKNLLNGDVAFKVDFRNIYGTILQNWLQADATAILSIKTKPEHFI